MTIVPVILDILKSGKHLSCVEEQLAVAMKDYLVSQLSYCLEQLDKEVIRDYCDDGWEIDRLEERQLTFFFGTVTFRRRRLRKSGEKSFLPLDKALGLKARERYSPLFKEKAGQLVTGMTYRQASQSLELLTNQSISRQSLHRMTQTVAEKLKASVLPEPETLRRPAVLYIEGDGIWIGSQEKDQSLEFKRGCLHEGVDRSDDKRPKLINPVYFGCFGKSQDLFEQMSEYVQSHYDLRGSIIVANSDGGSGYEADKFETVFGRTKYFHYCLDSYHVMKYLTGKLGFDKELQTALRQAVKAYDVSKVRVLLDTAESYIETQKHLDYLSDVQGYLTRYWFAIKPLYMREGALSDGVGICESGHRYYTNRLKRQGRNWSRSGAENMALLMTAQRNGTFETLYRTAYPHVPLQPEVSVSVGRLLRRNVNESHIIAPASIPLNAPTSSPIGKLKKWI